MHGNVWEWCEDSYSGWQVIRGGSCDDTADWCRAAFRNGLHPTGGNFNLGLRLARVPAR